MGTRWQLGPVHCRIDALSTEDVQVPVGLTGPTGPGDPSSGTVSLAFLAGTTKPQATDWNTGSWEGTAVGGWLAQCLVGSGGVVLTSGTYYIWLKIVDGVETVVEQVGTLEVT